MKLLSECAKAVALKQGDRTIAPRHMLAAMQHLHPQDGTAYLLFFRELKKHTRKAIGPVFASNTELHTWLAHARNAPPMDLAPALTRLISTRGGMGFALTQLPDTAPTPQPQAQPALQPQTQQTRTPLTTQTTPLSGAVPPPNLTLADVARVRQHLLATVLGQAAAIEALTDALAKSLYHAGPPAPLATFMLVGASATGKTHLAQQLASALGPDWRSLHIQLGALTDPNHTAELDGTEPSYRNAQPGRLTSHVRQHPRSVVVLEDADLAHPALLQRLLPVLATGQLRDRFGFYPKGDTSQPALAPPEVDFAQTIILFTTRAGHAAYQDPGFLALASQTPQQAADTLLSELRHTPAAGPRDGASGPQFPPALWQHLPAQRVLWLRPLGLEQLCTLAAHSLQTVLPRFEARLGCRVQWPSNDTAADAIPNTAPGTTPNATSSTPPSPPHALLLALVLAQGPEPDARSVQHAASTWQLDPITDHLLAQPTAPATTASWQLAPQALEGLQHALASLGPDPLRHLMRHRFKLHTTHTAECHAQGQGRHLQLTLHTASLQRITQAADVRGPAALQVQAPGVSFADIAGHHVVKTRLQDMVALMKQPQRLRSLGVALPKGVLLYGPPGTGKTMLAKALAHEAELPFLPTTGVALRDPALLTTVMARARQYAPSVVFVDEIDALGRRDEGGHTLAINQLLTELDGFDTHQHPPVFVVAATNQPQRLDPALLRPGRIDTRIEVPHLDRDARAHFVDRYLALTHDGSLCRHTLLDQTSGMGGAALEQARREAALDMVRTCQPHITQAQLLEHIHTLKYGPRHQRARTQRQREATAYHEAGHAVVAQVLNPDVPIAHISIDPRGNAEGFVAFDPEAMASRHMTKKEVMDEICILLAGRLSEQMFLGEDGVSAGAEGDLARASQLAWMAVTRWGMDEDWGLYSGNLTQANFSILNSVSATISKNFLKRCESSSQNFISKHKDKVLALAREILNHARSI